MSGGLGENRSRYTANWVYSLYFSLNKTFQDHKWQSCENEMNVKWKFGQEYLEYPLL